MSTTAAPAILVAERRGPVEWIRFNRPEVRNAITLESADRLAEAIAAAERTEARVIVLAGSGGSFCAGADLKAIGSNLGEKFNVRELLIRHYHRAIRAMVDSPLPVIAAVDGGAAGIGNDIALAADLRLITERAYFCQAFVNIGLMPDGGGTYSAPRLAGVARAMEMAMLGNRVSSGDALDWGLVNHVYPVDGFEDRVQRYAETLAGKAPLSLARSKRAIRASLEGKSFAEALLLEADLQQELIESQDFVEGVSAFLTKRPPEFQGR